MSGRCIWIIVVGGADAAANLAAAKLAPYGVEIRGQAWNAEQPNDWMNHAHSAAQAGAHFVIVVSSAQDYLSTTLGRELALFRLFLQTLTKSTINGLVKLTDAEQVGSAVNDLPGTLILGDWETITADTWPARAVARLHAPIKPAWPVTLGIFAQEKLGTWLQIQPEPGQTALGCLLGVSGNNADISFHAVGQAGCLPEHSTNEFELKGMTFSSAGHDFNAWGLQNTLTPDQAYFARLDGEPDILGISTLPEGQLGDIHLMYLR